VRTGHLRRAADLVDRMLDELGPALRATGDEARVGRALDALWQRGTGADLQRADLARGGSPAEVVRAAAARTASRSAG
jgi:carboxylate-amine ligase